MTQTLVAKTEASRTSDAHESALPLPTELGAPQDIPLWAHAAPVNWTELTINRSRNLRERQVHPEGGLLRSRRAQSAAAHRVRDFQEERRAQTAAARLSDATETATRLAGHFGKPPMRSGRVHPSILRSLEPFTGPLPENLSLQTGPAVERILRADGSLGLAVGHEVWVGGASLERSPEAFANVFVHEAAHVASGASLSTPLPRFDHDDPLAGSWLEAEQRRQAELEAAETGAGRQRTFGRLAEMSHQEARREAPGIAYRAQDRGDVALAVAAADRLLQGWLASTEHPVTYTAGFGPDDAVDILLTRADTALGAGNLDLGGKYLSVAIVQLVRAANAVVSRRNPGGGAPELAFLRDAFLPMQRADEIEIRDRVQRVHELIERHGRRIVAQDDPALAERFERVAESVHTAERQAGPRIAEDLGDIGPTETPGSPQRRLGGRAPASSSAQAEAPPPRPEPTPEVPVSRAEEFIVDSAHSELEGALVFHSVNPQDTYANIRSPRYAVAGTLAGAHRLANELFGRRTSVIVEDIHARNPQNRSQRQVRYLVLALSVRLNPPEASLGANGEVVAFSNLQMLLRPAARQYFFLAVVSGPWQFFAPNLLNYIRNIQASEQGVEAPTLAPEERREVIFNPIEDLIAEGETQEAADRLSYLGAQGFALVNTETKIRYLVTLLNAFTFEAHEQTVVEVFRSLSGPAELRAVLDGLQREGVLRNLYRDLQSAFPSLLFAVGQAMGASPLSESRVRALLREVGIMSPFPGIEIRGDGSVAFDTDLGVELREAVEGLINTLTAAVTGILDILSDPAAFLHGIYKLIYFAIMADLASRGNPRAQRYVARAVGSMARHLGNALNGLAILQENMPSGVEFVRDLERAVKWRIIWEVVGLFVGVGEAVALIDAIRGGRALSALSDLARVGRGARAVQAADEAAEAARIAEAAGDVGRSARAAEETGEAARGAARAEARAATPEAVAPGRSPHSRPTESAAPAGELSMAGGRHRIGVRNGQISLCSGCGPLNDKLNHVLDIIPDDIWYRRYYYELRTDVRRLQRQFDAGLLTEQQFTQQAEQLAGRLDRLIQASDPNLGHLLSLRPEELASVAPGMRRSARAGSDRLRTVLDDFAERQRRGRTSARESAGGEVPGDVDAPGHVETYPSTRGPATARGEWSGTPRNSEWTPADENVWRMMGYRSIPYRNGYPDLSQFIFEYPAGGRAQVIVPRNVFFSGGRNPHFRFADERFARRMGWLNPDGTGNIARARAFRSSQQLTWHHVEFDTLLQLVPRPIHEAAQHAGGIATAGSL